jgi:hypothetical protein
METKVHMVVEALSFCLVYKCPEPLTHSIGDHGAMAALAPADGAERTLGATAGLCAMMPYNYNCNCTTVGDKKFRLPKRC